MRQLTIKLKKKINQKETQVLFENFFSLSLLKAVTMLLPLAILPHLAKVLEIELVGLLALVTAIVGYARTIIDYGFSYTGVREIAKANSNNYEITKIFLEITLAKLILILICCLSFSIIYPFIGWIEQHALLIALSFLNVALLSLSPDWFFQGIEKMRVIAVGEILGKILSFLLIVFFVKGKNDLLLVPTFYSLGQIFSLLIYVNFIFKYLERINFNSISLKTIISRYKEGWSIFLNILFPNLYNSYSYISVGYFGGVAQVAIYDIARKFLSVSEIVVTVLSRVFFPSISRSIHKHKNYMKILISIAIFLCSIQAIFAPFIIDIFFPRSYENSKAVVLWQTLAPLAYALMTGYGLNYLVPLSKDKELTDITIKSSLVGFILVTLLTYRYGAMGAALGVFFTWTFRAILCYKTYKLVNSTK